jgi:hypothetical protein
MTSMGDRRRSDLIRFYALLGILEKKLGGKLKLAACSGKMAWPRRGVYFFFENHEVRSDSGGGLRVVRVGTHALHSGSNTTLWNRLSQHRGVARTGGGNHRGSIFRLIVGTALAEKEGFPVSSWGKGNTADKKVRDDELDHERNVSAVIGAMPFLWLQVDDNPGSTSMRGTIERNAIALLSNYARETLDPQSSEWLGQFCDRERVRLSGMWNQNHVDERHDPEFLNVLERLIGKMERAV